jgi:apolipoprotein N-acyltransferase
MTDRRPGPLFSDAWLCWGGMGLTAFLLLCSFPPFGHPFVAFFALIPATLAAAAAPAWRLWRRAAYVTSWVLWIALLAWLRHIYPPLGWLGLVLLTAYCALYPFVWLLALRWIFPACREAGAPARLLATLGLAGAWGLLEWLRTTALTGFGWLPFAASQQGNGVLLTLCAWVGPTGLSIGLVLINLGLASWIFRLRTLRASAEALEPVTPTRWLRRLTPELYLGLAVIAAGFYGTLTQLSRETPRQEVRIAAIRTDFDPTEKWDSGKLDKHAKALNNLTVATGLEKPDVVVWPEAALPLSTENAGYVTFLRGNVAGAGCPLLIGAIEPRKDGYANSVVAVTAEGLVKPTYAKRHLVPFGEYVPLADWLPLRKVVPIAEDCVAGEGATLLPLTSRRGFTFLAGPLVCYEDVFPELAREHALAGADLLVVVTNDGWYGHEAGDAQHTAHSVLIAAATGLPVARAGNAGWSGVISHRGILQPTGLPGQPLSAVAQVRRDRGEPTFWVRHGDWAVGLGGLCFALTYLWRRRRIAHAA